MSDEPPPARPRAAWVRTAIIAAITGALFSLIYTGLEILSEDPAARHSISIWHTPLIAILASILFFLILYAVGTVRDGKIRERFVTLGLSVAGAILLALFWLLPMLSTLVGCLRGAGC